MPLRVEDICADPVSPGQILSLGIEMQRLEVGRDGFCFRKRCGKTGLYQPLRSHTEHRSHLSEIVFRMVLDAPERSIAIRHLRCLDGAELVPGQVARAV